MTRQLAGRCCDVDRAVGRVADDTDREVPQCCGDAREGPGANLRQVFSKGHVANPVKAVLDGPVSVHEPEEVLDARVVVSEIGDVVAGPDAVAHVAQGGGLALDDDVGLRVGEGDRGRDRC